jgi:hypothetical protein
MERAVAHAELTDRRARDARAEALVDLDQRVLDDSPLGDVGHDSPMLV